MKVLVTGRSGQVGWELHRSLLPLGEIVALDHPDIDLSDPEGLRPVVREIRPDVIVNAAAYTAVDKAESEEDLATRVNSVSPGVLAEEAERTGALLVHYSTDYIYDGSKDGLYTEEDEPNPLNAYGRSKLGGELAIRRTDADHLILRTSWVYAGRGKNFVRTILRLACEREELDIIGDQIGSPTWARQIADITAHCVRQSCHERRKGIFLSGSYNLVASGETSWHGFAGSIVKFARNNGFGKMMVRKINPIGTTDYPTPARRPLNSRLSTRAIERKFGITPARWNEALELCLDGLNCSRDL